MATIWPLTGRLAGDIADLRASSMRSRVKILTQAQAAADRYGRLVETWADPATANSIPAGAKASTRDAGMSADSYPAR